MRVLLINQYAGSPELGMEYRPHWMAREWREAGHDVLVVAADWTHLRRGPLGRHVGLQSVEGVPYLALPVTRHRGNGPLRFVNMLSFSTALWLSAPRLIRWRPDVVVASSTHPLDVRPAHAIAKRSGASFVHEVHDLWPLTPRLLGGLSPSHPMIRLMQRDEDFACRKADRVVSILPATKDYLVSRGMEPAKWVHVSNGVPPLADPTPPSPPPDPPFRIGYFGTHGVANDLGTVIAAMRLLQEEPIELHLTGSGESKAELQEDAADLPRVHFHEPVTPAEARERMRTMHALIWGGADSPLYTHGVGQNKVFDYMASGVPLISHITSPATPCTGVDCDVSVGGGDPEAVAEAIRTMRSLPMVERFRMGQRAQRHVADNASFPVLSAEFLAGLDPSGRG